MNGYSSARLDYLSKLIGCPKALFVAFVLMVLAGVCGAVIATSAIESTTYTTFLMGRHGAYGIQPFCGKTWVTLEHACFWLSLVALGFGIFTAPEIATWLYK